MYGELASIREIVDLLPEEVLDSAEAARRAGMVNLREDGLSKAARGITTIEEILRTVV